jgi:hypothetical protein
MSKATDEGHVGRRDLARDVITALVVLLVSAIASELVGDASRLNWIWHVALITYGVAAAAGTLVLFHARRGAVAWWFGIAAALGAVILFVTARIVYEQPPTVHIALSNTDDEQVVLVNDEEKGSAGFGENRRYALGRLDSSDRIEVRVTNDNGGYLWDIKLRRGGEQVFHDRSDGDFGKRGHNNNDKHVGLVHRVVLNGRGRVLECYTHKSTRQQCFDQFVEP